VIIAVAMTWRGGDARVTYLLSTPNGTFAAAVSPDGRVQARADPTLFGRSRDQLPLPLRHLGHADEGIGLHCNGARYFDPELRLFLSPEPRGLEGGLRPYVHVDGFGRVGGTSAPRNPAYGSSPSQRRSHPIRTTDGTTDSPVLGVFDTSFNRVR